MKVAAKIVDGGKVQRFNYRNWCIVTIQNIWLHQNRIHNLWWMQTRRVFLRLGIFHSKNMANQQLNNLGHHRIKKENQRRLKQKAIKMSRCRDYCQSFLVQFNASILS